MSSESQERKTHFLGKKKKLIREYFSMIYPSVWEGARMVKVQFYDQGLIFEIMKTYSYHVLNITKLLW